MYHTGTWLHCYKPWCQSWITLVQTIAKLTTTGILRAAVMGLSGASDVVQACKRPESRCIAAQPASLRDRSTSSTLHKGRQVEACSSTWCQTRSSSHQGSWLHQRERLSLHLFLFHTKIRAAHQRVLYRDPVPTKGGHLDHRSHVLHNVASYRRSRGPPCMRPRRPRMRHPRRGRALECTRPHLLQYRPDSASRLRTSCPTLPLCIPLITTAASTMQTEENMPRSWPALTICRCEMRMPVTG